MSTPGLTDNVAKSMAERYAADGMFYSSLCRGVVTKKQVQEMMPEDFARMADILSPTLADKFAAQGVLTTVAHGNNPPVEVLKRMPAAVRAVVAMFASNRDMYKKAGINMCPYTNSL